MMTVIPSSLNNVSLVPGIAFTPRKSDNSSSFSVSRKPLRNTLYFHRLLSPISTSVRLFPSFGKDGLLCHDARIPKLLATETDVAVGELSSQVATEHSSDGSEEVLSTANVTTEKSSIKSDGDAGQARRTRPVRKSEMPPVKNEELVLGATFTGKVRSIQPFGAFIDFGAFTDGLVHVSQLSDSYVKDVASVVSVGQEVKVRLVEVNNESGRISLTMRESEKVGKPQQRKDYPASVDKAGSARKNTQKPRPKKDEVKKVSKFAKGQDLKGTVKNLTRAGAFISLPEGEEGFLPSSEEVSEGFGNLMGGSSLEAGQEIEVRVLRITRGQVTLTMKKDEDYAKLDSQLNQGVVHTATNPFVIAFSNNKDIAQFLSEKEKVEKAAQKTVVEKVTEILESQFNQSEAISDDLTKVAEESEEIPTATDETGEDDGASADIANVGDDIESAVSSSSSDIDDSVETMDKEVERSSETNPLETIASADNEKIELDQTDTVDEDKASVLSEDKTEKDDEAASNKADEEAAEKADTLPEDSTDDTTPENIVSSLDNIVENIAETIEEITELSSEIETVESSVSDEPPQQISSPESQAEEEIVPSQDDDGLEKDEVEIQIQPAVNESEAANSVQDKDEVESQIQPAVNESEAATLVQDKDEVESQIQPAVNESEAANSVQDTDEVESQIQPAVNEIEAATPVQDKDEVESQIQPAVNESEAATPVQDKEVEQVPDKNGNATQAGSVVSPALVKQLREETGAGMMDCKRALTESGGDIVKAQEFLRKKGLASADKKASRATAEGRIGSYIHDNRIGILVEVNCETDFVSRGDIFKELVDDLAMQAAACPQVKYLMTEDVPDEIVRKEKEIEMQKEDLMSKPEQIREKIVEGRIRKRLEELALLEQPYIKNDKVVVKDWVKQTIATIGENIKVKRFVRFNLGEGLEKKSQDFAAEVAAQTQARTVSAPAKESAPLVGGGEETATKPPTVAVSAGLVKQLREETGAGMMDCKKALSATGGDLEKAQEYLRKKGLSSAEKKSSRLAAEGRIGSYIHDSRIGVLIEVNCETDFVGRSENFRELVDDLAMQIVACPLVKYVSIEDIPESIVAKEKEIEMQRDDLQSKPENIREKIVEGRVSKRLGELALLEQPFIKNDTLLIKDLVKQTVAALGENIKVRRFVRFTIGETDRC